MSRVCGATTTVVTLPSGAGTREHELHARCAGRLGQHGSARGDRLGGDRRNQSGVGVESGQLQ